MIGFSPLALAHHHAFTIRSEDGMFTLRKLLGDRPTGSSGSTILEALDSNDIR